MPPPRPNAPLVARHHERARLAALIDSAGAGRGGALALTGEAGMGKTALLDEAEQAARGRGLRVLRCTGLEDEVGLPWAALGALCLADPDHIDQLPSPQARALRAALALEDPDGPIDPLAVALGALGCWSDAARRDPLLVIVDDLQWVDVESRRALDLIAGRLGDDPIGLLLAGRPDPRPSRIEELEVGALPEDAIVAILVGVGVAAPAVRQAVAAAASGSPLLARQLAAGLDAEQRAGVRPMPVAIPIPVELEDLYRPQLSGLGADALLALAVMAADPTGLLATVTSALVELGLGSEDLEPAELAGLVEIDGGTICFTHPVARSAAYQAADGPVRRRAHEALATVEGPHTPRGILHRSAAATGADDALAEELTELAWDAHHRGAPMAAATRFVQAARHAETRHDRAGILVGAAQAALLAGQPGWAADLVAEARSSDADRAACLDARRVEVRAAVAAGRTDEARRQAAEIDAALAETDPIGVSEVLSEVARPLLPLAPAEAVPLIERAWELARDLPGAAARHAEVLYACRCLVVGEREEAERRISSWRELLEVEGAVGSSAFLAETVVPYLGHVGRRAEAMVVLDELEAPVRAGCASGALVPLLGVRALLAYGTDLGASVRSAREAMELARATNQVGLTPIARTSLSIAAANVGDEELTAEVCDLLLATGQRTDAIWARASLGRLHLVHDRPVAAAAQFDLLLAELGEVNDTFTHFEADAAEAYIRAGRVDDARALLPVLAERVPSSPWSSAMHERTLALLAADIDVASEHFARAADDAAQTENLIAQGVVAFTWGERLRRAKRRAQARQQLERAVELFGRAGAEGYRARAAAELRAAGGVGDRTAPPGELLTDLELVIARAAVAGATNREIANQLILSPRTVENHLSSVYRKLGVSGRAALVDRASTDPTLAGGPSG